MVSKKLFGSVRGGRMQVPVTTAVNAAGGKAYAFDAKHALAQYAATGCLTNTFYTSDKEQLDTVLDLAGKVDQTFLAKVAVYARGKRFMKDMPALLCAVLGSKREGHNPLFHRVFDRVIDNGKMLQNFVAVVRSGKLGKKCLNGGYRSAVRRWFSNRGPDVLFRQSIGNDPSMADILKMAHPRPRDAMREATYGYLVGKSRCMRFSSPGELPANIKAFEAFKKGEGPVPDVPFQFLTALELKPEHWVEIARKAPWQMTRMNLQTFSRHGVFKRPDMVHMIAARLREVEEIKRARVFPYQLLMAFKMADDLPTEIRDALQDAMEKATENVPALPGHIVLCPDVSGSMRSAVTGDRGIGATSKVQCIDVAALITACVLRKNPTATVLPFESDVVKLTLNSRDSVMTNAKRLGSVGGGGTDCSSALRYAIDHQIQADLVIYVSDNESWADFQGRRGSEAAHLWQQIRMARPWAKMVLIDLVPNKSTQVMDDPNVLNIGGFNDEVFNLIDQFVAGASAEHWVAEVEKTEF